MFFPSYERPSFTPITISADSQYFPNSTFMD
jgi:hypothetical protein